MSAKHPDHPDTVLELVKPILGELVTPFIRAVCAALAVGFVFLGWQPLTDPDAAAFDRPLFDGVFQFADPRVWGAAFLVSAAGLLLTAITGRAGLYLASLVTATVTLAAWASTIIYTALTNDEAVLTLTAIGLYILDFVALVGLAMSPRQLSTVERPVIARLEDDGTVVELKQLDRRAV